MTTTHQPQAPDQATPAASESAQVQPSQRAPRPLYLAGAIAACAAAMAGLAALTLIAAVGWIAAPHTTLGGGLPGVLRTAIQLWLVGHHVGFLLHSAGLHSAGLHSAGLHSAGLHSAGLGGAGLGGAGLGGAGVDGTAHIGLLPLGLVLLPGAVLWRSGRWVVRSGQLTRLRHAGYAAIALAVPYALLTGSLAMACQTPVSSPSPVEAALAGFLLAFVAGGLGALRALARWRRLISLLPDRARCLVAGVTGSLAVLAGAGALLTGMSLIAHASEFSLASDDLAPGLIGSALLLLTALAYLPNAVIWAIAYLLGPGFAFGVGTAVTPTGSVLGALPLFPMLAALPAGSPVSSSAAPGWAGPVLLAVPFLAGAFGGLLTVRTAPSLSIEIAPLWGLGSGVLSGVVLGTLAAFSGGPLGSGRLATTGPVGWQVGLVAALELGIAAAISAGLANWLLIRRLTPSTPSSAAVPSTAATSPTGRATAPEFVEDTEPVLPPDVRIIPNPAAAAPAVTSPPVAPSAPMEFIEDTEPVLPPKPRTTRSGTVPAPPADPEPESVDDAGPVDDAESVDDAGSADDAEADLPPKSTITSGPLDPSSPIEPPSTPAEPEESTGRVIYLVPPLPDDE